MVLQLVFIGFQLLFGVTIFYLMIAFVTGAPFVPSNTNAAKSMIALAKLKKGMNVYDLGSGDGRLLFYAAQKHATVVGYEINLLLVLFTYIKKILSPYNANISVVWHDFWSADLHTANVVFVYLLPWKMERLERKLINELPKGALVISNSFIFPHLKQIDMDEKNHIFVFANV
jgi:16S rRNA A1518/A1519 N6-dimethyltransferase RsmA/KsgA/DIM1 with predicted DNA glycosylase/AP lyase activity